MRLAIMRERAIDRVRLWATRRSRVLACVRDLLACSVGHGEPCAEHGEGEVVLALGEEADKGGGESRIFEEAVGSLEDLGHEGGDVCASKGWVKRI